jgi:hypothetical protein
VDPLWTYVHSSRSTAAFHPSTGGLDGHEGHRSTGYSLYKLQISGFRAQEVYIVPQLYMTGLVALDSEPHRSEDGFPKSTEAPGTQTC